MKPCPRCGSQNPPEQRACASCGAPLAGVPKQTMLGWGASTLASETSDQPGMAANTGPAAIEATPRENSGSVKAEGNSVHTESTPKATAAAEPIAAAPAPR